MYKVDLHTHSIISHDGGLTEVQYTRILQQHVVDYIAITDHNETSFARILHGKLGDRIIVGEEIKTTDGEVIGLFLEKTVPGGLSAEETVQKIHEQNGLVYIPHPFETFRKGLQATILEKLAGEIDIMEIFNGRGRWRHKNAQAASFAATYGIVGAASSDAHCIRGIGRTYSSLFGEPSRKHFTEFFQKAELHKEYAPLVSFLCPAINRIKNKIIV